jgi:alkanesulfonate monooxygenase SsuD/methylene tetrahydromethanopterin reductase-like flavin-dependent oxidoreductase (luciferase family)
MTTVYVLPLRDAFTAAKAVSTAAVLSGNRVALGVGVGWQRAEFDLVGREFHGRGRRADEQIEVMRKLMSGHMVEHHGAYHDFAPLQMSPTPSEPVPIYVGGDSRAARRRAARHDGWLGLQYEEDRIAPLVQEVRRLRAEAGRNADPFEVWVAVRDPERDTFRRLEEMGVTMTNGVSFLVDGRVAPTTLAEKQRRMKEFAARFLSRST